MHSTAQSAAARQWQEATLEFDDPAVEKQYPPDLELEPVHLDIDLSVDLAAETIAGTVTTTVRARRDGPTELKLDAVGFLDLAVHDPEGHELAWSYDGRKLAVIWQQPLARAEERRLAVAYRVVSPADGLFFSHPDEHYPDRVWYAATDHETERARHWLPCVDAPNVRTSLSFHLRAEQRFTILANGRLVGETLHADGTKTAEWRLDQLCPSYLVCFAIGELVRHDDGVFHDGEKEIPLAYFCSREHTAADLARSFGRTRPMMAWLTAKLNLPFPYPKYYQFALPEFMGAMENISLVSWSDTAITSADSAREHGWWIDSVNIHEMAHSYFGDAVVIRDYAHTWLKESWATYMEQCWSEDNEGPDEALYVFYDHAQAYFEEADERYKRPIVTRGFRSSWQMYDRHTYPGGACRLHTLRGELGDDVFWAAVTDYLRRYHGQVVETDDFRRMLEEHSGRSLGRFFDQWFFSPGYPDLKVSFKHDDNEKLGSFEIVQQQVNAEKGIPPFELKTEVGWTIDGQRHTQNVHFEKERHVVTVRMEREPEMVRFDPHSRFLHKLSFNPGDPMLRTQLSQAPDVVGRIQAAYELAKAGGRENILAIVEAYEQEPFWGVRQYMAKALAEARSDEAVAGLARITGAESDPRAMRFAFRSAGEFRDTRIRDALRARLQADLPPLSKEAAYLAMGAQRDLADWDLLVEGAQTESFNGFAQSGALRALAATRREEAVGLLLEASQYGRHSRRVRPRCRQRPGRHWPGSGAPAARAGTRTAGGSAARSAIWCAAGRRSGPGRGRRSSSYRRLARLPPDVSRAEPLPR
jgi:aminopeptidase N